ncbi:MAG: ATP-binding protein, partial [Lentisphaeria bacterium]|nr:ATP-binding protein [Lentisphaeria bacterium]
FGPPGTGKTMCAEALAGALGKKLIDVSYAEIESKYVGETGKNIRAAFSKAAEMDCVLFFDEADSILGRRMTNVTQAADHGVNVARAVMLKELDQFEGVVAFATNLARNFDGAFVRRILQHVLIPLPSLECRGLLWQRMIPQAVPGRNQLNWDLLAEESDGFSGGDIKNAVLISLAEAVAREPKDRFVTSQDIRNAIASVRRGQEHVGSRPVTRYQETVDLESTVKPAPSVEDSSSEDAVQGA